MRVVLDQRVHQLQLGHGRQRDGGVARNLGAGDADLAVAHGRVHVAAAEQRAIDRHGEVQRSAGGDSRVVHVAAMAARGAAVHRLALGSHADDADHGAQRDVQALIPSQRIALDLAVMRGPLGEAVAAHALVLASGGAGLIVELDVLDAHLQRAASLRALDEHRAGRRVDGVPVQIVHGVPRAGQLVAEAVLRADAHRLAGLHGQHRLKIAVEGEQRLIVVKLDHGFPSYPCKAAAPRRRPFLRYPATPLRPNVGGGSYSPLSS